MSDSQPNEPAQDLDEPRSRLPDWAVLLIIAEAAAVMIGLVMPLTPSKTGSDWSLATLVTPTPSYLTEVAVYFLVTNLLVLVIALVGWHALRRTRTASGGPPPLDHQSRR